MIVDAYRPADLAAVYHVCLATGDSGADATGLYADPNLLGHLYAGPYACLESEHAFVLRDGDGVQGYVVGARDTAAFEERCERRWWPPLRAMYPADAPRPERDAALVRKLHERSRTSPELVAAYPSHLHIDLLPAAQGRGLGRTAMETLLASLAAAGSPGVHLGVGKRNVRAIGFYARVGFERVIEEERALIMGREL